MSGGAEMDEVCAGFRAAGAGYPANDALLTAAHGQNGLFHQLLDGPAQALGAGVDDITGAAGGELLVLVLFLQTADLHVHDALAGTHAGGGADEARQFVGSEQHLLHFVGGLHIAAQAVAVGADGVDELIGTAGLLQQLRRLDAVLLRPHLKVDVVEQAHRGPEVRILAAAQLVGIPAHDTLHRQTVQNVERFLIILFQGGQRRFAGDALFHLPDLLCGVELPPILAGYSLLSSCFPAGAAGRRRVRTPPD